jgi:hypothetical protein
MKTVRLFFLGFSLLSLASPAFAEEVGAGASLRLRWETTDAAFFGPVGAPEQDVLLTRALAFVEGEFAPTWRGRIELGWHAQSGREAPLPTDENALDLQQAWIEAPLGDARLRVGRQELVLGSARLVGVRDSPNIRRSFDGAVLDWRADQWRVRSFALTTVDVRPEAFNDPSNEDVVLAGVYATRSAEGDGLSTDWYALRLRREQARFAGGAEEETRWTMGTRLFGRIGAVDFNVEPMAQLGEFDDRSIRAWTVASDTGLTFANAPLRPRLGLKANITSGDDNLGDRRLGTFDPLFPNLAYFSEAATLSPQNHFDVQPDVTLHLSPTLTFRAGSDWFWRSETADAVYRAGGAPVSGTAGAPGRFTSRQIDLELRWRPNERVELRGSIVGWHPGEMLQARGADGGVFAMASVTLR